MMILSRIITTPGTPTCAAQPCATRRIWEVDPSILSVITGVLLDREDAEAILNGTGQDWGAAREDALRIRLVLSCGTPCRLAEEVERVLNGRTQELRGAIESCPMMQLADWWSSERDRMPGEQVAALLWCLCADPRPYLEPLASRVSGDLRTRAMRLLREESRTAAVRTSVPEIHETAALAPQAPRRAPDNEVTVAAA